MPLLRSMQLGISMLGLSEAMLMGKKLGLDSELLGNIINTSTGQCWASSVSRVFQLVIGLFSGSEGRGGVRIGIRRGMSARRIGGG
jgi:3-hydroxyisobutyrate dehydrogenase